MACILDAGVDAQCDDSLGGIEQGSILIAQWDTIETDWVATAGEITSLNQVAATYFYRYHVNNDGADFLATETHKPETGNYFETGVLNFTLGKMSKEKNVLWKTLASKSCVIIFKDNNGVFHIIGLERGADKIGTNTRGTGRVAGDLNGYLASFTDISKNAYTVSSSVMASIAIDGEST